MYIVSMKLLSTLPFQKNSMHHYSFPLHMGISSYIAALKYCNWKHSHPQILITDPGRSAFINIADVRYLQVAAYYFFTLTLTLYDIKTE